MSVAAESVHGFAHTQADTSVAWNNPLPTTWIMWRRPDYKSLLLRWYILLLLLCAYSCIDDKRSKVAEEMYLHEQWRNFAISGRSKGPTEAMANIIAVDLQGGQLAAQAIWSTANRISSWCIPDNATIMLSPKQVGSQTTPPASSSPGLISKF